MRTDFGRKIAMLLLGIIGLVYSFSPVDLMPMFAGDDLIVLAVTILGIAKIKRLPEPEE